MFTFSTKIKAIDPSTGYLVVFAGPQIRSISKHHAQKWCNNNGFGYLEVDDIIVTSLEYNEEGVVINKRDYDIIMYN